MNGEKTSTRKVVRHILTFKFSKLQRIYLFKSWLLWKVSVCQTCSSAFNFNNNFDSLGLDLACCQSCSVDMLYHSVQEQPWATWDHSGPCLDPRGSGFSVKVLRNKLEETAQSSHGAGGWEVFRRSAPWCSEPQTHGYGHFLLQHKLESATNPCDETLMSLEAKR